MVIVVLPMAAEAADSKEQLRCVLLQAHVPIQLRQLVAEHLSLIMVVQLHQDVQQDGLWGQLLVILQISPMYHVFQLVIVVAMPAQIAGWQKLMVFVEVAMEPGAMEYRHQLVLAEPITIFQLGQECITGNVQVQITQLELAQTRSAALMLHANHIMLLILVILLTLADSLLVMDLIRLSELIGGHILVLVLIRHLAQIPLTCAV